MRAGRAWLAPSALLLCAQAGIVNATAGPKSPAIASASVTASATAGPKSAAAVSVTAAASAADAAATGAVIASAGASASAITAAVASATATPPDRPIRLPLESYRKGVAARVEIGGRPRLLQFDTGGGLTVLSPALAKEIGCRPWGAVTGFHMTGTKITGARCDGIAVNWAGTTLVSPMAVVLDFGPTDPPTDGLLALDVFAGRTITIDFVRRELVIETPASTEARVRGATEVPAHLAREVGGAALSVFIEAPTARGPLRLELDSGNGGTILVSRPMLPLLGLPDTGDKPRQGRFAIAKEVEAEGTIFSPDLVIDGNLGMPFLKHWIVTLDLKAGRAWLRRNDVAPPAGMGTPPPVPAQ